MTCLYMKCNNGLKWVKSVKKKINPEQLGKHNYTIFYKCDTPHVLLIWHVQGHASAITRHFHPCLETA